VEELQKEKLRLARPVSIAASGGHGSGELQILLIKANQKQG
jgi:hypothetical protein